MSVYTPAANTAYGLLLRKGLPVTITRRTPGTFDPVTQQETGASTKTISMLGLALPPGKSADFRVGSLQGRNVLEFHFAPREVESLQPGDIVAWGGKEWTIFWVSNLDPIGAGAAYTLAYAER